MLHGSPSKVSYALPKWQVIEEVNYVAKAKERNDDDVTVIKKYANRRLYNTQESSYVTLEHLAEMVRRGEEFVVNDAKTGEDITRSVLAQIIFEEEAKGHNMLPTNFLRQLIGLYGDTLQSFVPSYLEASMNTFTKNQEEIRDKVQASFGENPAMANFEAMARTNMELFDKAMRMFSPFAGNAGGVGGVSEPTPEPAADSKETADLNDLKEQLAQMQDQLSKLAGDK